MSAGQMLPVIMSPWQLEFVQDGPRNLYLKFGQNWVSKSWNISEIELSGPKSFSRFFLFFAKYFFFFQKKLMAKMSLWLLVYVQDCPRNLPLKFGQNWVSNSWDIPYMDKCCKDKYCLDRCHCDSWNMFIKVPGTYI